MLKKGIAIMLELEMVKKQTQLVYGRQCAHHIDYENGKIWKKRLPKPSKSIQKE
jgi:hypothetical protein